MYSFVYVHVFLSYKCMYSLYMCMYFFVYVHVFLCVSACAFWCKHANFFVCVHCQRCASASVFGRRRVPFGSWAHVLCSVKTSSSCSMRMYFLFGGRVLILANTSFLTYLCILSVYERCSFHCATWYLHRQYFVRKGSLVRCVAKKRIALKPQTIRHVL